MNTTHAPDPVATEIIRNGLIAATEEMKTNLMRTAYNMIIYEALDFTVGLFDAAGNTISIGIGLPMFIRGMSDTVKAKLREYDREGLRPGDVLLTNDAYLTGSHLNHMTFSVPIFHEGTLLAFASCMAHWQDIGGTIGGLTRDIYSEGLQMPIVKIYREGVANEELLSIIRMNVRFPERALGDLRAQIAAVKTGEKRFLELVRKYGQDTVLGAMASIMDQSEAAARAAVRLIPDGVYEASSFMDDDGVDVGQRIPIAVKVTVADDRMVIDLTDVAGQVKGFYNSGETAGRSCAQVAYKCLTSALELPINDGCFRPLEIILPPGRVVSAVKPAPMRWRMTFPMTIVDTIFKALAPAIPNKVIAGHHADLVIASIHGRRPGNGELFLYMGGLIGGGWGAKLGEDGVSGTIAINDGDTHNGPSEQVEAKYPVLVERYGLREDSGGPGRNRGGLGTEQVVRALADMMINTQVERVDCRPWGLFGGLSGAGNQVGLQRVGEEPVTFPTGKVFSVMLHTGDRYMLRSGGGGGTGSPLERPVADVERDCVAGYVSTEAARDLYGVVMAAGRADPAATDARRALMRDAGLPQDLHFTLDGPSPAQAACGHPGHDHAGHAHSHDPEVAALEEEIRVAGLYLQRCC
jgi:N-methylhydantoinase B